MSGFGEGSDPVALGFGIVVKQTDRAILVDLEEHGETWIPCSVVSEDSEVYDDNANSEGFVSVARWWAEKEGLD